MRTHPIASSPSTAEKRAEEIKRIIASKSLRPQSQQGPSPLNVLRSNNEGSTNKFRGQPSATGSEWSAAATAGATDIARGKGIPLNAPPLPTQGASQTPMNTLQGHRVLSAGMTKIGLPASSQDTEMNITRAQDIEIRERQQRIVSYCEALPWWRRIVVDSAFRRRVAAYATRALRAEEEYLRADDDAQNICLPPLFRWESMSAENRAVISSSGPLDGVTHRWTGPFPPQGYVQVTPNVLNLRPVPEKKGPLHINVYIPLRAKRREFMLVDEAAERKKKLRQQEEQTKRQTEKDAISSDDEDDLDANNMTTKTIGRIINEYEEKQRQLQQASAENNTRLMRQAQDSKNGKREIRHEGGVMYVDGIPLEQRFIGTLRPSFLLLRWKVICNALHEFASTCSPPPTAACAPPSTTAGQSPRAAASTVASSTLPSQCAPDGVKSSDESGGSGGGGSTASPAVFLHNGKLPSWLQGIPLFRFPLISVESKATVVHPPTKQGDPRRIVAFPPNQSFLSIRREDMPSSRRMNLYNSASCKRAVHRVFNMLPKDITSRVTKVAYVEFLLDLLHVFFPTYHSQSNIETAEDEWLCRGTPELPDFQVFFQNWFDLPLILCREDTTVNEDMYVAVWDTLFEALYGRELLLQLYEAENKKQNTSSHHASRQHGGGGASQQPLFLREDDPIGRLVECPTLKNTDRYSLYLVADQIKRDPLVQKAEEARRPFLLHRIATAKLQQRTQQEREASALMEQHRLHGGGASSATTSPTTRKKRKGPPAAISDIVDDDDDDQFMEGTTTSSNRISSPSHPATDPFPSLAMQERTISSLTASSSGQLSEKQREEARRVNAMRSVENKASSLSLFEEVYEPSTMERDEVDEILDYCSDISDEEFDVPSNPIRMKYESAVEQREEVRNRMRQFDTEQDGSSNKRKGATGDKKTADDKRRISTISRLRQPSVMFDLMTKGALIKGNLEEEAKLDQAELFQRLTDERLTDAARRDVGDVDDSRIGAGGTEFEAGVAFDRQYKDISKGLCDRANHGGQTRRAELLCLVDPDRAERIKREERERVRGMAAAVFRRETEPFTSAATPSSTSPQRSARGGGQSAQQRPTLSVGSNRSGIASAGAPSSGRPHASYATFREDHCGTLLKSTEVNLVTDDTTEMVAPEGSTIVPVVNGAASIRPPSTGQKKPVSGLNPLTSASAHAALTVNPFLSLRDTARRLLETPETATSASTPRGNPVVAPSPIQLSSDPVVEGVPSTNHNTPESTTANSSGIAAFLQHEQNRHESRQRAEALLREMMRQQDEADRQAALKAQCEEEERLRIAQARKIKTPKKTDGDKPLPSFLNRRNQQRFGSLTTSTLTRHYPNGAMPPTQPLSLAKPFSGGAAQDSAAVPHLRRPISANKDAEPEPQAPSSVVVVASPVRTRNVPPNSNFVPPAPSNFFEKSAAMPICPIRPPKYQFPKFHIRREPEELRVNGTVVPKQHTTMALVQMIHLGQLSVPQDNGEEYEESPRPLGMGRPSPRVAIVANDRAVIVVPTESLRDNKSGALVSGVDSQRIHW